MAFLKDRGPNVDTKTYTRLPWKGKIESGKRVAWIFAEIEDKGLKTSTHTKLQVIQLGKILEIVRTLVITTGVTGSEFTQVLGPMGSRKKNLLHDWRLLNLFKTISTWMNHGRQHRWTSSLHGRGTSCGALGSCIARPYEYKSRP